MHVMRVSMRSSLNQPVPDFVSQANFLLREREKECSRCNVSAVIEFFSEQFFFFHVSSTIAVTFC